MLSRWADGRMSTETVVSGFRIVQGRLLERMQQVAAGIAARNALLGAAVLGVANT